MASASARGPGARIGPRTELRLGLETDSLGPARGYGGPVNWIRRHLPETADAALALLLFGTGVWFVVGKPFAEDVVEGPTGLNLVAVAL